MWVDHERKLLYIHIPKTGGSALIHMLGGLEKLIYSHARLKELPDPEDYKDYRIFTIVRDPYRRYISAYRHVYIKFMQDTNESMKPRHRNMIFSSLQSLGGYVQRTIDTNKLIIQSEYIDHEALKPEIFKYEDTEISQIIPGTQNIEKREGYDMNYWGDYDWREWIDETGIMLINKYCHRDFKELGYEKKDH